MAWRSHQAPVWVRLGRATSAASCSAVSASIQPLTSVSTWSIWAVVPVAGITVLYVVAALGEEKKFSRTLLAGDYQAYRGRAGLFWPRLGW